MSTQLNQKTFEKLVDNVLEYNRTPRKDLFEYPYNEFESRDLIKNAEALVRKMVATINRSAAAQAQAKTEPATASPASSPVSSGGSFTV